MARRWLNLIVLAIIASLGIASQCSALCLLSAFETSLSTEHCHQQTGSHEAPNTSDECSHHDMQASGPEIKDAAHRVIIPDAGPVLVSAEYRPLQAALVMLLGTHTGMRDPGIRFSSILRI
jgi:hypothetical protein